MTPPKQPDDHRPALARKHTRTTENKRDQALDQGLKLTVDGNVYEARLGDVTPEIAAELRAATGMGFLKMYETVANDPDIDLVSAFVWVARRIRGDDVAFEDVKVTYAQMFADDFDVDMPDSAKADIDENPEA